MHQPNLADSSRSARRGAGVYYTPSLVAAYIVRQALQQFCTTMKSAVTKERFRILDPACGNGVFLQEAYRVLLDWQQGSDHSSESPLAQEQRLLSQLFGVDQDAVAVEATRERLARLAIGVDDGSSFNVAQRKAAQKLQAELSANVRHGNALIEPSGVSGLAVSRVRPLDWQSDFAAVLLDGGFDVIVGNPPYINIRQLSSVHGEPIKSYLRDQYTCARRAFDAYVLFIEKAYQLLKPGGVCGFIVPNKIGSLDYAEPCRDLLLKKTTLCRIDDLADLKLFSDAKVYPYVLIWKKQAAHTGHHIHVAHVSSTNQLHSKPVSSRIRQSGLSASSGFTIHGTLDVESRVPTLPLAQQALLHSGTTGFYAQQVADALADGEPETSGFDFIVSGNIDRYRIQRGNIRFMRRRFQNPVLPAHAGCLTEKKRRLYQDRKIVIAGMTRRLEAAYDQDGLALGVQVYAATDFREDPRFLLGLLNSKVVSYLFQVRFQAKRLAAGYLSINKGQLAKLPIRIIVSKERTDQACRDRVIELVASMLTLRPGLDEQLEGPERTRTLQRINQIDHEIDRLVYQLYKLTPREIERIEQAVSD